MQMKGRLGLWALVIFLMVSSSGITGKAEERINDEVTGYGVPMEEAGASWELVTDNPDILGEYYSSEELTSEAVYNRMIAKQEEYPEGMTWTNDNYYAWQGGIYRGGYGCAGFAFILSDAAFGSLPARILADKCFGAIRTGDILRLSSDTHSVIVLEVYEDHVVVAEGNYGRSIHWGRKLTRAYLEKGALTYIMTRYPTDPTEHNFAMVSRNGNEAVVQCTDCGTEKNIFLAKGVTIGINDVWSSSFESGIVLEREEEIKYKFLLSSDGESCDDVMEMEIADGQVACFSDGSTKHRGNSGTIKAKGDGTTTLTIRSVYTSEILKTYELVVGNGVCPHELILIEEKEATCTVDGHESYWQCSICEKYFEDALATKEITDLSSLTIKASHEFETTWSVDELHHWYACTKCQTEKKSYAEHVYSSIGDTDCNICGYVRVLPDRIVVEDIFKDVTKGSWCVASIQFVYEKGIMNGKSAATFGTGDSITRAEFAQVLYNMEGKPSVQFQDKFIDVNESQWFAKAVSWAYAKQIASGYGNGSFGVNDSITREQLAVMLYKYAGVKGYSQAGSQDDLEKFTDLDTIHSWAETAMNWAVDQGIMSGRKQADGSYLLDPAGKATRAECAAMLKNFCEAFGR